MTAYVIEKHYGLDTDDPDSIRVDVDMLTVSERAAVDLLWRRFAGSPSDRLVLRTDHRECPTCRGMPLPEGSGYSGTDTCGTCAGTGRVP